MESEPSPDELASLRNESDFDERFPVGSAIAADSPAASDPKAPRKIVPLLPAVQLLPQSPDAEKGVLCSFLLSPREVGTVCAERRVSTEHFFSPSNSHIYRVLLELWSEEKPIDFILLTQVLRDRQLLDICGGAAFITDLFTLLPTAANATRYLDILEEKRILRQIITICTDHAARSYTEQDDCPGLLSGVQERIMAICARATAKVLTMKENVLDAICALEGRASEAAGVVKTGLKALDEDVGPLERGMLVVIGGNTKAGKSIVSGQIALNLGFAGKPVLYITLEMSERELTLRWIASIARVNIRLPGLWSEADYARSSAAGSTLAGLPLVIVTRRFQLSEIVATCQQFATKYAATAEPLACIVLDYAQLASATRGGRDERRQQEIAEISRTCKRLAGSLNVLFILLTQLNDDGRSRESRDIENDANLMLEVGHNKESGERGVRVVLARSAPMGQRLKLRIIAEHTRVENDEREFTEEEDPAKRRKTWRK